MESMEPRVPSLLGRISSTHFKSKIRLEVTSISLLLAFKKLLVPLVLCHLHTSSARGREKSSDDIFVCERVCTSKRMLKKVGSFSEDPIPDTCVTVCGVSKLDACARTVSETTITINGASIPLEKRDPPSGPVLATNGPSILLLCSTSAFIVLDSHHH
ncbi:hypothetical protein K1719_044086 [Acacia pycnantha]|nr:hypothetical protein K1719_044086 [Acacia pycnantha]